jgi:hypothetical protein
MTQKWGLDWKKCATVSLKSGKVHRKRHIGNTKENEIKELKSMKAYKYLDVEERHNIKHNNEKEKLKKEYVRRLRSILNTELSAKSKMQATGTLAIPVLRYSFRIMNSHQQVEKVDRKPKKIPTIHGQ